jgi:hypothetical protein
VLFLIPLQCVNLFCNLSKSILLFFSYISSLLLLFSWHPLLKQSTMFHCHITRLGGPVYCIVLFLFS